MKKLVLIPLLFLAASAIPARANTIAISGSFSGTGTLSGGVESFNGTGTDTTFGSFTATESATLDLTNFPTSVALSNGTFSFTFGVGNLAGTFSGSGPSSGISVTFLITSGFLPGDTGTATGSGTITPLTATTADITGSYTGTINTTGTLVQNPNDPAFFELVNTTPLPASLPLFATGIGGLGLLGWRRKRKAQAT